MTFSIQRYSLWLSIITSLMHIFCCGLPLLMGVLSFTTLLGITGLQWPALGWFGRNEPYIMVASGVLLFIIGIIVTLAEHINCRTENHCVHSACDNKKDYTRLVFIIATMLYAGNTLSQYISR